MTLQRVSLIIYCISLVTPIFFGETALGIYALMMGWMGVLAMEIQFALPWTANLIFFWCIFTPETKRMRKIFLSITTLCLAFFATRIIEIPAQEGTEPVTLGIGFYIWISSFTLLFIHTLRLYKTFQINSYPEE